MPSTLPGSFASAAAGNISDSSGRQYARAEPSAFADWARRPNGATQTFRRSSSTTANSAQTNPRDSNSNPSPAGAYVPPHVSASRNGSAVDTRYSKSQLLDLFREQRDMGDLDDDLTDFYVGDALSGLNNGIPTPKWGRREESKNEYGAPGPDICWERGGAIEPLALVDMSEEEKELFANSVNSPLKGPSQSVTRDGAPREAALGRKISVSHPQAAAHGFGLSSPSAARTTTRRRDTNDSYPFPRDSTATISATNATLREDPSDTTSPSGPLRRKTDALEIPPDRHNEVEPERDTAGSIVPGFGPSFGSFKRSVTNPLGTGSSGSPSNWPASSQNSAVSTLSAFGNLGLGSQPTSSGSKRPDLGPSRESRFRGLMNKGKPEGKSEGPQEKQSVGSIGKLTDEGLRSDTPTDISKSFEQTATDDPETLAAESAFFGSSAQNNRQQESSNLPHQQTEYGGLHRFEDEHRPRELDTSQDPPSSRSFDESHIRDHNTGPPTRNYYQSSTAVAEEPLSPTFTNPYSSPLQQMPALRDIGSDEFDMANLHLPGLGELQNQAIHDVPGTGIYNARRDLNRAPSYDLRQSDRGQYPSSNAGRGFPTLGGLGGLGGFGGSEAWSAGVGTGTPLREKAQFSDFGGQIAGSAPHLQSPNVTGSDPGTIGRGGRLGSLFPTAMQEQMRIDPAKVQRDERPLPVVSENLDGLAGISSSRPDLDSPFRMGGHGKFDDFSASADTGSAFHSREGALAGDQLNNAAHSSQPPNFGQQQQQYTTQPSAQRAISVINAASNQPPAAQQKTMVMPDRIRWIYRDPQGNTQGPWSGLEMHDWYRAGFFSPELLVKKAEDADYEPLAQLIRRIGNSREPFLVPQIGIPGPPSSQSNTNWPSQTVVSSPSAAAAAAAQPPFAGSFPSFGTTLTAEQQNALERRKQEEQYLMARQKEHLAQQQLHVRQMQGQHGVHPQQLQHHSSAQSLQSQPSYGSMTSPNGFQASPPQNLNHMSTTSATGFESSFRLGGGIGIGPIGSGVDNLGHIREEDHSTFSERVSLDQDRKGLSDAQRSMGQAHYPDAASFEERTAAMLADRALVERQQAEEDYLSQSRDRPDDPLVNERLKEFQEMRMNTDNEGYRDSYKDKSLAKESAPSSGKQSNTEFPLGWRSQIDESQRRNEQERLPEARNLSLTEQVQQAASSKQSPASSWARADTTAPEAAPPQSASPLPAPAARRGRTNVADTLAAESLSQSQSPMDETPTSSIAPWAKESSETQKQPSLREIQEIEARKAAKLEEIAATSRRAALEREMANQPLPPAPGLPSSSTWGSSESPLSASATGQFSWAKPTMSKGAAASSGSGKKSLQQIQAEEEAATRKKKASAASNATIASQVTGAAQAMSSGKRYADLAGKNASPTPSGAWTTVGASGKAKGPIATPAPLSGLKSTGSPSITSAATPTRPKPTTANSKTSLAAAKQNAQDELKKWATAELRPDLDKNIQVDEFVQTLLNFPPDTDMITEVVHQNSSTIDSRHFAEEFMRRRGLAEKGKTDSSGASGSHYPPQSNEIKGGGWSEVARKGSATNTNVTKEEASGAFKIVAGKKKGKR